MAVICTLKWVPKSIKPQKTDEGRFRCPDLQAKYYKRININNNWLFRKLTSFRLETQYTRLEKPGSATRGGDASLIILKRFLPTIIPALLISKTTFSECKNRDPELTTDVNQPEVLTEHLGVAVLARDTNNHECPAHLGWISIIMTLNANYIADSSTVKHFAFAWLLR